MFWIVFMFSMFLTKMLSKKWKKLLKQINANTDNNKNKSTKSKFSKTKAWTMGLQDPKTKHTGHEDIKPYI